MNERKEVSGRVEIHRTKSVNPKNAGKVWLRNRAAGNLRILSHSELLGSKREAIANIRATARLYNGTMPEVWDCTGSEPVMLQWTDYDA